MRSASGPGCSTIKIGDIAENCLVFDTELFSEGKKPGRDDQKANGAGDGWSDLLGSGGVTISGFGRENATLNTEKRQGGFEKSVHSTNWRTNPEKPEHRSQIIEIPGQICGREKR